MRHCVSRSQQTWVRHVGLRHVGLRHVGQRHVGLRHVGLRHMGLRLQTDSAFSALWKTVRIRYDSRTQSLTPLVQRRVARRRLREPGQGPTAFPCLLWDRVGAGVSVQ